jgi:Arc/MetJ-type ribon-helix-helix transcriptional regulator
MATMNISLPSALGDWVDRQIKTGPYASKSDYVCNLIRRDQKYHWTIHIRCVHHTPRTAKP